MARTSLATALLVGGASGGWFARGWLTDAGVGATSRTYDVVELDRPEPGRVPSLVGLPEADARQAILDAGGRADQVRSTTVPQAGEAGLVVTQEPAPDRPLAKAALTLQISSAASVPAITGRPLDEARTALAKLGADVTTTFAYRPGAKENTVLRSDPAPGASLTGPIALVVAQPQSSVFLSSLDGTDEGCQKVEDASTDEHAVVCTSTPDDSGDPPTMVYALDGPADGFAASVRTDAGTGRCELSGAAGTLGAFTVTSTETQVAVAIGGARELTLRCRATGSGSAPVEIRLGDARLSGASSAIDAISGSGTP